MIHIPEIAKVLFPPWLLGLVGERLDRFRRSLSVREQYADNHPLMNLVASWTSALWPKKAILFFPEGPHWRAVEYKLCALLGYTITTDPGQKFDVAFKRKDATFFDPEVLEQIPARKDRILNAQSVDISKRNLGTVFRDVFGYPLEVDPTRYEGEMVEKSDANAAHDGRIIRGPLTPGNIRPGCVYQRLIDNASEEEGLVLDYRLPVYGDEIPLVYLKYRPVVTRFSNENAFVRLGEPSALFSETELANIRLLARRMGIDYGEFDVLRDRDGRIYVTDTNNTPAGPPNGLPPAECKNALARLAQSFDRLLSRWPTSPGRTDPAKSPLEADAKA